MEAPMESKTLEERKKKWKEKKDMQILPAKQMLVWGRRNKLPVCISDIPPRLQGPQDEIFPREKVLIVFRHKLCRCCAFFRCYELGSR